MPMCWICVKDTSGVKHLEEIVGSVVKATGVSHLEESLAKCWSCGDDASGVGHWEVTVAMY